MGGLGYGDEEHSEDDPPEVVGKLAAELLADEIGAGFGVWGGKRVGVRGVVGEEAVEEVAWFEGVDGRGWWGVWCWWRGEGGFGDGGGVVGVDAQGALFVDVGVAHGYYDGVDGDVHHDYVEDEEANAHVGDGDDVEAA